MNPEVDSLAVLGGVIEELMDVTPVGDVDALNDCKARRQRLVDALEEYGFRYYRGGRVLPTGQMPEVSSIAAPSASQNIQAMPSDVWQLLETLIKGVRRAMHPLTHRRKGAQPLVFENEYDVQDLLHTLMRPWVSDIRPEEFTPSYAGSSTRMDFLLPKYRLVLELKFVRDRQHARKIGDELIIDDCDDLWCVIFDTKHLLTNADGLKDLEGERVTQDGEIRVKVFVV